MTRVILNSFQDLMTEPENIELHIQAFILFEMKK